ncbi:uncharacterized protein LOC111697861 [Eurytemora carolleeae]|uniref:uncharacterized protein LOC111697861 n=1 Tax=Eurytemora carolleeae TaxID=1294199 RepID=UPI000C76FC35|nr:uncharacterized protein LOC111697861 [Eurytemora carolleeae]|eukprot:XP_023323764.1 uncharacterized protein LOC111697861 [Eurytemora affinis]
MLKTEFEEMNKKKDFSKLAGFKSPSSLVKEEEEEVRTVGGVGNPGLSLPDIPFSHQHPFLNQNKNSQNKSGVRLNLPSSLERILASGSNNPLKSHIEAHWQPTSNSQILPQLFNNQAWGNYQQGQVQLPLHLNNPDSFPQPRLQQIQQEVSQHEPEAGGSGLSPPTDIAKWLMENSEMKPIEFRRKPSAFKSPVNVKAPTALELFGNFKTEDFNPLENSAGVFNIPSSISKFFSDSSKQEDTTAPPVRNITDIGEITDITDIRNITDIGEITDITYIKV